MEFYVNCQRDNIFYFTPIIRRKQSGSMVRMVADMVNRQEKGTVQRQVQTGFECMAQSRVAICGLARDCREPLAKLAPALERLGECFEAYRIIVVENDSKDGTADFLSEWSADNPNIRPVQFSTCPWVADQVQAGEKGNWWFSKARMQRMNFARNLYLETLEENGSVDYAIVVDLDILSFSLAGIAHTFGLNEHWDFVASNGCRYSIRHPFRKQVYWDAYVYEPAEGFPGGVLQTRDILARQKQLPKLLHKHALLPVRSAFGGLCIYRREALGKHRYFIVENEDPEVEVLCDHTTLHRLMAEAGCTHAFINARQAVSYESLGNTLRRLLTRS